MCNKPEWSHLLPLAGSILPSEKAPLYLDERQLKQLNACVVHIVMASPTITIETHQHESWRRTTTNCLVGEGGANQIIPPSFPSLFRSLFLSLFFSLPSPFFLFFPQQLRWQTSITVTVNVFAIKFPVVSSRKQQYKEALSAATQQYIDRQIDTRQVDIICIYIYVYIYIYICYVI